ncbi:putative TRAP-type C4-dicarboxylate transport system, small permease component [Vibrio nigripulchritudo MADA3029]|uniref:TRAP transporter small permease n=1 Tax=Vibrio nigripulchritudo TaxID=28173 RepID=UPI0003B1E315|nr:TRAP transporter small permease subunit [Vibrio nigripulchritudo]CCN49631.1 putative TRAP-type C4-dicarboxylate transport system, small permease component [Vibrio nigripulchritudo MADA3020]CCN53634.1 putative TRAP-type C4-dicarboxylate transport system, small permease component [Vibrio nigripulchritudo MADA3021]CCN58466.1 putative TRAP-type C4-dicarboxylate transport system, small permease component [Vibrio nigripulchritudo MADA3029]
MQKFFKSLISWQGKIEMAVCMFLTLAIVATIAYQIIARFFFNAPIAWMEEAVTIMFILLTLLSAAVATKEKRHIIVDLFPKGKIARALSIIMSIITVVTLITLLFHISPIIKTELRRSTISLPINFPIAFYNSVPLIYCFVSICMSITYDVMFERKADQEALV